MQLELSRLRWPEWLIGAGGALLLISMVLLPWFQQLSSTPGPPPKFFVASSLDGWHGVTHARWLMLVTILAALAVAFFQARERAPALPIAFTLIATLLAGLTVLWLIYRVWIDPPGGREIGGWIGLISSAAILYGGYKSIRMEGIAERDGPAEIPTVRLGKEGAT